MSDCPECGMRDDDWFLCRRDNCATKAKDADTVVVDRLQRENAELREERAVILIEAMASIVRAQNGNRHHDINELLDRASDYLAAATLRRPA